MWSLGVPTAALENDRRAAERHQQPGEHRRPPLHSEGHHDGRDQSGGDADLDGAAAQHQPGKPPHAFEAELDAEREQQQHHADVRRLVHKIHITDETDPARAYNRARCQEADDRHRTAPSRAVTRAIRVPATIRIASSSNSGGAEAASSIH